MKHVRFYLEYADAAHKRKGTVKNPGPHEGNVFAAYLRDGKRPGDQGALQVHRSGNVWVVEGLGAVYYWPNSAVMGTAYSIDLLHERCRRIPEKLAREIHPALFEWLDEEEEEDSAN